MSRHELQVQSRDLPQEARPYEETEIPSQDQELSERGADEGIPISGQGEPKTLGGRRGIPCRGGQFNLAYPQRMADGIDHHEEQQLGALRVAEVPRGGEDGIVSWPVCWADETALDEQSLDGQELTV